jgi:hypothetical protein
MNSKWSLPPRNGEKGCFCTCGEIAFVKDLTNNPRPENPTPCFKHYLEICELRKAQNLEVQDNGTNRDQ